MEMYSRLRWSVLQPSTVSTLANPPLIISSSLLIIPIGRGRGPCSQRGCQVNELANVTLRLQKGPIIGAGQAIWNNVHIHDLSKVYALLVDAAVADRADHGL